MSEPATTEDELVERGMAIVRRLLAKQQAELEAALLPVCQQYRFGAVMQAASEMWQRRDPIGALKVCECPRTVAR